MGYFIDHALNHHKEEPIKEYLKIQDIIENPLDVKLDISKDRPTLLFIKQYDKFFVEVISVSEGVDDKLILHKSFFHRKKMPHKALPSVAKDVSPADEITAISPATNNEAAASSDFSALGDVSKDTPSLPNSQTEETKSNVAKKDKPITTSDLFPKVDNSKKLGKEISRQSAVTDKNVTLTRIDYENGYVCRVENKQGDFVEQAYNADGTPMSQALYNIGIDNNQFKDFVKQDADGLYIKDKHLFEVLVQNAEQQKDILPNEEAPLTEDKFEEALNTNDIDKVTDALKLTRNAIELNSIDDIQEGDIVLVTRPDIELLTNKSNTAGTYIYEAKQRLSNSYMLEDIYADGDIALTDQNIQEMKGRSKNASYTIYRAKPQSATKDSPTSRKHKAEAEAQTATTEDTALLDAVADIMQQSGLEVFVDEKAQQVLDEVNERARLNAKQKRALETASLENNPRSLTVVSSADGANVLKKLDTLATTLEKSATQPKTFLGDLAQALGASTKGSSSQYATFETINGQIVTIRLANHNASTKRMDDAGRDNAISIVISAKPNEGVTNDGDAHIVEFYYNSIKLRKAEGHPLAEIVRSIKQALYSGEYKDTTGLADVIEVNNPRYFRTPGGQAYGFTVNGKIYLDPRIATAETAIHEYAHLWADMLRQMNPEAWNDIVQLMKGTSVWDEVKSLYPELKTDDEIADEVLAHYSGRQGAAKLREEHHRIAHDQNMDLRSKATAIAALERIKQALTKFWKGVADLLHIRFTTAEEVADRVLADLLHGVNPNKYIKRKGKGVQKLHLNDKTLAGIHNITEENLRKALNLGGLANPSLAIIDTDQNKHEGFGEISLIAPSELVDKETGHTAGTWTTDAYTQRYPKVERVMSEAGYKKFDKWVESLDLTDSEKAEVRRQAKDSLENNSAPAWEMMYLREKGIDTNAYTSKAPYEWKQMLDTYDSVDELLEGMKLDEELQKKVINYVKAELSKPTKEKIREQLREQIKEETGTAPAILPPRYWKQVTEIFNRDYAKDLFGEDLMPGEEDVKKVMQQLFDLHNRTRQVDFGLSKSKASTYVHSHDLYSDYLRWQDKKLKEFGVKGRLFRGYSADGSRKYIPETLKNVSKAMVADANGQTNGGEMVSLGSFVAKFADRVDSTDEMRANKKRLANNESKQGFYSEWMPTYNELADELSDDIFAGEQRLHDIAVQDNPVKYAKKEYGITLSKSFMDKLNAFKKAIREDMTSAYFETKFERPVYLNEFAAAVIPSDLSEDVKGGLEKSGIAIYEYDPKIEGDRDRATNAAFEADNRIRFQLVGEKGAAAIDKAESSNGAVLYREDSENSNHPYEVFTGNEAIEQLDGVLNDDTILLPDLPMPIRSLTEFQRVFAQPVRSAIGEYLNIKDDVYNKIIRENRSAISGALLPTIQNPDFVIRDVDGSNLYVKRFVSANSGNKYNIVAVNKHGEIEDYVSSVHVKRDNNIRNKIKNGAELLLPNERNTDGINIRNNSTPAANVIQSPNTSNTLQRENAENNAKSATEAPITQAANRTAGSLHLDNVTILGEQDLASLTPKQRSAKGWFDPKTGRIYINASNHANEADVVQTVLHEAVAHFGLRALFGKDFDTMLDQVYRAAGSALYDANINHLYVCEVFLASKIENGNTLQTAASQPHGGIALYKDILANVLDTANVAQSFDTSNTLQRKHARLMYPSSAKQLSRL